MKKKTILIIGLISFLILGILVLNPLKQKSSVSSQITISEPTAVQPSKTLKTYSDPSGFSFSYPDNLSLLNNELKDSSSYAELQLTASGIDGSLVLKIADSKLSSINEWLKLNEAVKNSKEAMLGNLKALEVETTNKLLLGALDKGVLFTIEVPMGERRDFWMEVYKKVLADFSFTPQQDTNSSSGGSSDVSFEGEEVVY